MSNLAKRRKAKTTNDGAERIGQRFTRSEIAIGSTMPKTIHRRLVVDTFQLFKIRRRLRTFGETMSVRRVGRIDLRNRFARGTERRRG